MNVLLTAHQFFPDFSAGTETLTLATAKELQRQGHRVRVFAGFPARRRLRDAERFDTYSHKGVPVERFHYAGVAMGGNRNIVEAEYNNSFVAARFRESLGAWRPDVVHFFHLQRLSASVIDVCCELGIPTVFTPTDFWFLCPTVQLRLPGGELCEGPDDNAVNCLRHLVTLTQPASVGAIMQRTPQWLLDGVVRGVEATLSSTYLGASLQALTNRRTFLRERLRKIDRVLPPTEFMKATLLKNGVRPDRVVVSRYGIDRRHIRKRVKVGSGRCLRLGFIGTLNEAKGSHVAVQAVRALARGSDLDLRVYGRLDEFPNYVAQTQKLAAADPRIKFCGPFPNSAIGRILSSIDVLVVPSLWYENAPLVVYAAQAAGCLVIASNVPGLSELVEHGIDGLLFERGHADDLAAQLSRVIADRVLLRKLASQARGPKSITQYVSELCRLYQQLCRAPVARSRLSFA